MLSMSGICACSKKDKRHQLTFPFTHDFHSLLLARCEAVVRSADYFCNNRNYFLPIFLCPLDKDNFVFLQRWIDQHLGIPSMKTTMTVTNNSLCTSPLIWMIRQNHLQMLLSYSLPMPCFSIRPIKSASVNRGGGLVSPSIICKQY